MYTFLKIFCRNFIAIFVIFIPESVHHENAPSIFGKIVEKRVSMKKAEKLEGYPFIHHNFYLFEGSQNVDLSPFKYRSQAEAIEIFTMQK